MADDDDEFFDCEETNAAFSAHPLPRANSVAARTGTAAPALPATVAAERLRHAMALDLFSDSFETPAPVSAALAARAAQAPPPVTQPLATPLSAPSSGSSSTASRVASLSNRSSNSNSSTTAPASTAPRSNKPNAPPPTAANDADVEQLKYMVRDLNTGKMVRLDDFDSQFGSKFSLNTFDDAMRAAQGGPNSSLPQAEVDAVDQAEVQQKKEETGWFTRNIAKLFKRDDDDDELPDENPVDAGSSGKPVTDNNVKVRAKGKSELELSAARVIQQLAPHIGPIWSMKFSPDGCYLATAGQDSIVRVWVVVGSPAADSPEAAAMFASGSGSSSGTSTPLGSARGSGGSTPNSNRSAASPSPKLSGHGSGSAPGSGRGTHSAPNSGRGGAATASAIAAALSRPTPPGTPMSLNVSTFSSLQRDDMAALAGDEDPLEMPQAANIGHADVDEVHRPQARHIPSALGGRRVLYPTPLRMYAGHLSDVIDLAWSKSNFLLSASMDKTVRLWHVSRPKCLSIYQHSDFVTSIAFHPIEDRYFLSGSFDKKLRMWNIPEHRVVEWAQTANMITAACFSPNGKMAVAGLYTGEVTFYQTDGLKYFTQIECKNRHGKDSNGRKVTGLQYLPSGKKLLISTNDSRLRLYDMDDFSMTQKYKGLENNQLQIQATFNETGSRVICGSDDCNVYVWETSPPESHSFFSFAKDDTNQAYEHFKAHEVVATVAIFAPASTIRFGVRSDDHASQVHQLIVTAGYNGELKVIENRGRPKSI